MKAWAIFLSYAAGFLLIFPTFLGQTGFFDNAWGLSGGAAIGGEFTGGWFDTTEAGWLIPLFSSFVPFSLANYLAAPKGATHILMDFSAFSACILFASDVTLRAFLQYEAAEEPLAILGIFALAVNLALLVICVRYGGLKI